MVGNMAMENGGSFHHAERGLWAREGLWKDLSGGRSVLSYMRSILAAEWKTDDRKAELEAWGR